MTKTGPLVAILIIIAIISGLIVIGSKLVEDVAEISKLDVEVGLQVSGDDIILTLYGGTDLSRITKIRVRIDGVPNTSPAIDCTSLETGKPIVCTNLASGVTGSRFIIVEGVLTDASTAPLYHQRITFS